MKILNLPQIIIVKALAAIVVAFVFTPGVTIGIVVTMVDGMDVVLLFMKFFIVAVVVVLDPMYESE